MTQPFDPTIIIQDEAQLEIIEVAAGVAAALGCGVFIVGGFIRDTLLNRPARDLDLVVNGDAAGFAEALAKKLEAPLFALHLEVGMFRIPLKDRAFDQIDVAAMAGTLAQDLARRDLTVDAMAAPVESDQPEPDRRGVIDPLGGFADLARQTLRAVSPEAFQQDPARLLRCVRLGAELGFVIEPATERLIADCASLATAVAGERTREDLIKVLSLPAAGATIEYLDRLGLLTAIFTELEASRGVDQPREHHWDVLNHQLKTVSSFDWIARRGPWPFAGPEAHALIPWDEAVERYFEAPLNGGATRLALTRLAALIHDIGKPGTKTIQDSGRVRFFGHACRGAETAAEMLKRLRFSQREIKFVASMVDAHMRPNQMGPEAVAPTPKAVYRFMRDTGEAAVATLYLSLADHLAARGPTLELDNFRQHVTIVTYILAERARQLTQAQPARLVDGNELQTRLGQKPGPALGRLLEALAEAQATGEIATKEEAFELAQRLALQPPEDQRNRRKAR